MRKLQKIRKNKIIRSNILVNNGKLLFVELHFKLKKNFFSQNMKIKNTHLSLDE